MAQHYQSIVDGNCYLAEFPDSGHLMYFGDPLHFCEVVQDFLAKKG